MKYPEIWAAVLCFGCLAGGIYYANDQYYWVHLRLRLTECRIVAQGRHPAVFEVEDDDAAKRMVLSECAP